MANLSSVDWDDDFVPSAEACVEAWELLLATPALKEWHEKPETLRFEKVVREEANGNMLEEWSLYRRWPAASLPLETELAHRLLPLVDLARRVTTYSAPVEYTYPDQVPHPEPTEPIGIRNAWPVSLASLATGRAGVLAKSRQAQLASRPSSSFGTRHRS